MTSDTPSVGPLQFVRTFAAAVYSSSSQRFGLEVPGLGTVGSEATVTISNLMPLQYQALTMQVHSFFVRCGVRQAVNGVWRITSSGMTAMNRPSWVSHVTSNHCDEEPQHPHITLQYYESLDAFYAVAAKLHEGCFWNFPVAADVMMGCVSTAVR